MLTGQAKVDYQREYMRRRRAGLGKPTRAEREPTDSELRDAEYLVSRMKRCFYTPFGRAMTYGSDIDPKDSDAVARVARRIREHKSELKAKKKAWAEKLRASAAWDALELEALDSGWEYSQWPKKIFTCVFCDATSDKAKMVRQWGIALCLDCARESVRILESNAQV